MGVEAEVDMPDKDEVSPIFSDQRVARGCSSGKNAQFPTIDRRIIIFLEVRTPRKHAPFDSFLAQ